MDFRPYYAVSAIVNGALVIAGLFLCGLFRGHTIVVMAAVAAAGVAYISQIFMLYGRRKEGDILNAVSCVICFAAWIAMGVL